MRMREVRMREVRKSRDFSRDFSLFKTSVSPSERASERAGVMPTRSTNPRVYRDENDRLKQQLAEVRQSCLLLNHKIEGSETLLSKQKDVILGLKQQLQRQEVRHAKELRALNEAHSQVLKNFVKKHCIEVSGLEKKVRSVQKILHTSLLEGEEGGEKTDERVRDGADKAA